MKKHAFLIGSSLWKNSKGYLPGVKKDIVNFHRFLKSSTGGAYKDTEITIFENPQAYQLSYIIDKSVDLDIAIVYYSGHGFMQNSENYLNINSREFINVNELISNAKRQIIFIDACRTDSEWEHFGGIGGVGLYFDEEDKDLARQLYEDSVQNSSTGVVFIFSSRPNQTSTDTEEGGVYTLSFLDSLIDWSNSNVTTFIDIGQAFQQSLIKLKELDAFQSPRQYYLNNFEALKIAIAVNPTAYKKANQEKSMEIESNDSLQDLKVLLGISLAAILIGSIFND